MPDRRPILCLLMLAACSPEHRDVDFRRQRDRVGPAPRFDASSDERFGLAAGTPAEGTAALFAFELPAGWAAVPPAPRRDVDLRSATGVEIWVSQLPGDGGGALANLNRWRLQFGLAPVDDAALTELPRAPLLDGSAYRVDLGAADGARRLVGLMLFRPRGSVFVRMSGPPELVDATLPAFARFVSTLREPILAAEVAAPSSASGLRWTAPPSWFALPPSEFRVAHFRVAAQVEAWISVLGGDGGGLPANVGRWCEQVGREPLTPTELAALPVVDVLGRRAPFVDLTGPGDERGMFGVCCVLEDRTVFVRMEGPSAALRSRLAAFLRFCQTLEATE